MAGSSFYYGRILAEIQSKKRRNRLTIGGGLINFPSDATTPPSDLKTYKILFSGVLSTPNVKFMCADISNL